MMNTNKQGFVYVTIYPINIWEDKGAISGCKREKIQETYKREKR